MERKEYINRLSSACTIEDIIPISRFENECVGAAGSYFDEFMIRLKVLENWHKNEICCVTLYERNPMEYFKREEKLKRKLYSRRYMVLIKLRARREKDQINEIAVHAGIAFKSAFLNWIERKIHGWVSRLFDKIRGPVEFEEDAT